MTLDLCHNSLMAAFTSNGRRQPLNKNRFFSRFALLGGATLIAVLLVEVGPAQAVGKASAVGNASATAIAPVPGDVFISDDGDQVVEIPAGGGAQTTVASGMSDPVGLALDAKGDLFIADSNNNRVVKVPAGGGAQKTVGTGLNNPIGVAVDNEGDVFIDSQGNGIVAEVPAGGGTEATVYGDGGFGVAVDGQGDVFTSIEQGNDGSGGPGPRRPDLPGNWVEPTARNRGRPKGRSVYRRHRQQQGSGGSSRRWLPDHRGHRAEEPVRCGGRRRRRCVHRRQRQRPGG